MLLVLANTNNDISFVAAGVWLGSAAEWMERGSGSGNGAGMGD